MAEFCTGQYDPRSLGVIFSAEMALNELIALRVFAF